MTGTWPLNWQTGDILIAAQYGKGIGSVYDTTLGAPAASVDITSIIGSYAHLKLVISGRSAIVGTSDALVLRLNNDSAANYDHEEGVGNAAAANGVETFGQTSAVAGQLAGSTAPAGLFSTTIMWIPNYASSANNKLFVTANFSARSTTGTTGSMTTQIIGGFWRSSAAITRITLFPAGGNFATGTRVSLYGMGA